MANAWVLDKSALDYFYEATPYIPGETTNGPLVKTWFEYRLPNHGWFHVDVTFDFTRITEAEAFMIWYLPHTRFDYLDRVIVDYGGREVIHCGTLIETEGLLRLFDKVLNGINHWLTYDDCKSGLGSEGDKARKEVAELVLKYFQKRAQPNSCEDVK
jgi:hypothetical protein